MFPAGSCMLVPLRCMSRIKLDTRGVDFFLLAQASRSLFPQENVPGFHAAATASHMLARQKRSGKSEQSCGAVPVCDTGRPPSAHASPQPQREEAMAVADGSVAIN
jgi:hypothetical protein